VDWNHANVLQDWQAALGFQVDLTKQRPSASIAEKLNELSTISDSAAQHLPCSPPPAVQLITFSARYTKESERIFFRLRPLALPGNPGRVNFALSSRLPRVCFDETLIYYRLGTRDGWNTPLFSPGQSVFNTPESLKLTTVHERTFFAVDFGLQRTLANTSLLDLQTNLGSLTAVP